MIIRTQSELYCAIMDNYDEVLAGGNQKEDTFLWGYLLDAEKDAAMLLDPADQKGRVSQYRRLLSLELHRNELGDPLFWQEVSKLSGRNFLSMLPGQQKEEYKNVKSRFFKELIDDSRSNFRKKSRTAGAGYKDDISLLRAFEHYQRDGRFKDMGAPLDSKDDPVRNESSLSTGREYDSDYRKRCQEFYEYMKHVNLKKAFIPLWIDRDSGIGAYIIGSDYSGSDTSGYKPAIHNDTSACKLALLEIADILRSDDGLSLDIHFDMNAYSNYSIDELFDEYCDVIGTDEIGIESGAIYEGAYDVYQGLNDATALNLTKSDVPVELQKYIHFAEDDAKSSEEYAAVEMSSLQERRAADKQGQATRNYMMKNRNRRPGSGKR